MRHHEYLMLPLQAFRPQAGRMRLYSSDAPAAPDYKPVAEASEEAARLGHDLGTKQLDFAKQQYDDLAPFFKELSDNQMAISKETADQGRDYYEYQKDFRPVEQQMLTDAMQGREGEIAAYDAANQADAAKLTQSDGALYEDYKGEIENDVGRAIADTQGAHTRNLNQTIRQGLRYGASGAGIASEAGSLSLAQAQAQAAAANGTRSQGLSNVRQRLATGMQLRQGNMSAKNAQQSIDWAKRLDAAGLVKGLPGASQGAYGLAVSAGNSAGANSQAAGNQYMQGMGQGSGTIMQGQQTKVNGLSNVMNAQNAANANAPEDQTGAIAGAVGGIAMAF